MGKSGKVQVYYGPNNVGCLTTCVECGEPFKPSIGDMEPFSLETRMPVCLDCTEAAETVPDPFSNRSQSVEREVAGYYYATPEVTIGKHEWRMVVKESERGYGRVTEYQFRTPGATLWRPDCEWPTYNPHDGTYAGCPSSLRAKVFDPHRTQIDVALDGKTVPDSMMKPISAANETNESVKVGAMEEKLQANRDCMSTTDAIENIVEVLRAADGEDVARMYNLICSDQVRYIGDSLFERQQEATPSISSM